MKLTRRSLMAATAGSAMVARALAQTTADTPRDFGKEARDGMQRNAETLAKFPVPMATEPAFVFKA